MKWGMPDISRQTLHETGTIALLAILTLCIISSASAQITALIDEFDRTTPSPWYIAEEAGATSLSIEPNTGHDGSSTLRLDVSLFDPAGNQRCRIRRDLQPWMNVRPDEATTFRWEWKVSDVWETNFTNVRLNFKVPQDSSRLFYYDWYACTRYTFSYECLIPTVPNRWHCVSVSVDSLVRLLESQYPDLAGNIRLASLEIDVGGTRIQHVWLDNIYVGPARLCPFEDYPSPSLVESLDELSHSPKFHPNAAALGDADGDGDLDLYFASHLHPNPLLLNNGHGEFFQSKLKGAGDIGVGSSALFADLDNDGDQDILLANEYAISPPQLFENRGSGVFESGTERWGFISDPLNWTGFLVQDLDEDSYLDILLHHGYANHFRKKENQVNKFKINVFQSVKKRRYERIDSRLDAYWVYGLGTAHPAFADYDGDRISDLYAPLTELHYRQGAFEFNAAEQQLDILLKPGGNPYHTFCQGDYDNDGDLDLYACYLPWYPEAENSYRKSGVLLENRGVEGFVDVTDSVALTQTFTTEAAEFLDLNQDGWLDLYLLNVDMENALFINNGDGSFKNEIIGSGFEDSGGGNGLLSGDLDDDGDLDIVIVDYFLNYRVKLNPCNNNQFLKVNLIGTQSNRDGIGAVVRLFHHGRLGESDALLGYRQAAETGGKSSHSSRTIHFGTGEQRLVDLECVFPSGLRILRTGIRAGSTVTVVESGSQLFQLAVATPMILWRTSVQHLVKRLPLWLQGLPLLLAALLMGWLWPKKRRPLSKLAMLAAFVLFAMYIFWGFYPWFVAGYVGASLIVFATVTIPGAVARKRTHSHTDREQLYLELIQFRHQNKQVESPVDSLKFLLQNLSHRSTQPGPELAGHIHELISQIQTYTFPALQRIDHLARATKVNGGNGHLLNDRLRTLDQRLRRVEDTIVRGEIPHAEKTLNLLENLDESIDRLRAELSPEFSSVLADVLADVLKRYESEIAAKGITLRVDTDSADVLVRLPRQHLMFVLDNLVQNSLRVLANRTTRQLRLQVQQSAVMVRVDVIDSGPGIKEEFWEAIFDASFSTSAQGGGEGGGFGLYRSKELLQRFGGTIYVAESSADQGTTMRIELRYAEKSGASQ